MWCCVSVPVLPPNPLLPGECIPPGPFISYALPLCSVVLPVGAHAVVLLCGTPDGDCTLSWTCCPSAPRECGSYWGLLSTPSAGTHKKKTIGWLGPYEEAPAES